MNTQFENEVLKEEKIEESDDKCPRCNGSGDCSYCNGRGQIHHFGGGTEKCPTCGGSGNCQGCGGTGKRGGG